MRRKRAGVLAILSEGEADAAFFGKLAEARGGFPRFFMFPHKQHHGATAFGNMLNALKGNPRLFERLKGVLIVADCKDKPDDTFRSIRRQVKKARGFRVPEELLKISAEPADQPGVFVMLLPDENTSGALESLYAQAIVLKSPWRDKCVSDYLACDKSEVARWSAEKQAKARFHALVAASYEADPSRAAAHVFRSRNDDLIDLGAKCFDAVERRLRDFCEATE